MYLGRQPINHDPYRCISSAFAAYLSAGLTKGAWSPPGASGSLLACLMFGVSAETATLVVWVDENPRIVVVLRRVRAVLLGRRAEARARLFETLIAMVEGSSRC